MQLLLGSSPNIQVLHFTLPDLS
jgi:hypothetical protein